MAVLTKEKGFTPVMIRSFVAAILGMFYFGYNTGVINAPEDSIKDFIMESHKSHYGVGLEDQQLNVIFTCIVSAFIVGGMIGAMVGGFVAERVGRRRGVMASALIGVVGGVIAAISSPCLSWEVLLVGRLVVGLTAGLNTVVCPMYVAELAPVALRGGMGIGNQLAVTSGILIGQVLGLPNVLGGASTWPWLISLTVVPPLIQLALLPSCPNSPRYLAISLDDQEAAREALLQLRGGNVEMVDAEMEEMRLEKEEGKEITEIGVFQLLRSSALRPALVLCVMMHLSQQLSGMVAIFQYSVGFFVDAGVEKDKAGFANMGVGAIMVVMTFVSVFLMDRVGRRPLHLVGLVGMCVMSVVIVIAQNLDQSLLLIFLVYGFVVFFAVGPGGIPWMITGEVFTQGPRSAASAVAVFFNWSANLLVSLTFPLLKEPLGDFIFLPFAILLAALFVFLVLYLPETKGRTVGETMSLLKDRGWSTGYGTR